MSGKVIVFGSDGRKGMLEGINILKRATISTLGPSGTNVVFDRNTAHPIITKDGVSVAREINFSDHYKRTGAAIIKEAAEKTDTLCGDGTTTTILLAAELAEEGNRLVESGLHPVEIQKGMDDACEKVVAALDKFKRVVQDDEDILHVATISANNDEDVGKIVQEAYCGLGEGGVVNILDSHSKTGKTTVKFSKGIEINTGITSGKFITDKKSEQMIVENPCILLTTLVPTLDDMMDICNSALRYDVPFIIVSPDIDDDFEDSLKVQVASKKFKGGSIKAPGFNEFDKEEQLKDLAAAIGCNVITLKDELKELNNKIAQLALIKDKEERVAKFKSLFGSCERVQSHPTKTSFIGGGGTEELIKARVDELQSQIEKGKADENVGISEDEIDTLKKRMARLTGGFATIMVGAFSESRLKELKDRYEDAVRAVQAAISEGIVPGGGAALLKAAKTVEKNTKFAKKCTESYKAGYKAVLKVCRVPAIKIMENITSDYAFIISKIEHNLKSKAYGYDAKHEKECKDMFLAGIIDPVKVTKCALTYATSVAGIFITTNCLITDEAQNIDLIPNDPIMERLDPNYGVN